MKWIGQYIQSLIARFRNDVYLESPTAGGSDPDKFLGIDSDNKIIYRTGAEVLSDIGASSTTGDITAVNAGENLTGGGTSGDVELQSPDATTSSKGSASFSSTNFDVSSGAVSVKSEGISYTNINRTLIVTAGETIASNNNDITLPSSAAVKAYADLKHPLIEAGARLNANLIHDGTIGNTEFGRLNNCDFNIKTEVDLKAPLASPTFTGTLAAANIAATGTLRGKQLQFIYANWKDTADYGVDELFIPLAAQPEEMTTFAKEQSAIIMPTSGYVKEIICRTHGLNATAVAAAINWKVYTRAKNKKMNGSDGQVGATIEMDPSPAEDGTNDANTVTTGDLGTTYPWDKYDALGISMEWGAHGTENTDRIWITVVLEHDLTDLGY